MVPRRPTRRYAFVMSDVTAGGEAVPEAGIEVDLANIENLRQYWGFGKGATIIRWGTKGDLTRCHNAVLKAAKGGLTSDDAWGFCQNIHKLKYGRSNPRD